MKKRNYLGYRPESIFKKDEILKADQLAPSFQIVPFPPGKRRYSCKRNKGVHTPIEFIGKYKDWGTFEYPRSSLFEDKWVRLFICSGCRKKEYVYTKQKEGEVKYKKNGMPKWR